MAIDSTSSQPRRACPKCGESIVATAAKCRFCGEIFEDALRASSEAPAKVEKIGFELRGLGGFWMFIGLLLGLFGFIEFTEPGGPDAVGITCMVLAPVWLVVGLMTRFKRLWAVYCGLALSYLVLLGVAASIFTDPDPLAAVLGVIFIGIIVLTHRSIRAARKMVHAGVPLN